MIERQSRLRSVLTIELPVLAILAFALLPFVWMVLTSFRPNADSAAWPVQYLPSRLTLEHYSTLLSRTSFGANLVNSFVVATGAVTVGLLTSVPAAYAFSRFRFHGRQTLLTLFLLVNMVPVVLLIIPLFVLMRQLGLIDTYLGIIVGHSTFSIPFSIWMMSSYMNAIPVELDEAALIDGATRLQAVIRVILPLAMPGIVTVGIYIFITSWNEYLYAMMLSGDDVRPVTVALQLFVGEFSVQWGLLTAGGALVASPVVLLFLLVQRRIVGGMTAGAVKG